MLLAWGRSHRTSTDGELDPLGERSRPGRGPGRPRRPIEVALVAGPAPARRRPEADPGQRRGASGGRPRRAAADRRLRARGDAPRRRLAGPPPGRDRPAGGAALAGLRRGPRDLRAGRSSSGTACSGRSARSRPPATSCGSGTAVPRRRGRDRRGAAARCSRSSPGRWPRPTPRSRPRRPRRRARGCATSTNAPALPGESPRDALDAAARRDGREGGLERHDARRAAPRRRRVRRSTGGTWPAFASRGQQRTAILAFKLAELDLLTARRPAAAAAPRRRLPRARPGPARPLVRRIAELPQAFVTTTTLDDLDPALRAGGDAAGTVRAATTGRSGRGAARPMRRRAVTAPAPADGRGSATCCPTPRAASGSRTSSAWRGRSRPSTAIVAERVPAAAGACRVVRVDGVDARRRGRRADRGPGAPAPRAASSSRRSPRRRPAPGPGLRSSSRGVPAGPDAACRRRRLAAYTARTCQPISGRASRTDPGPASASAPSTPIPAPTATRDPDLAVRLQMKLGVDRRARPRARLARHSRRRRADDRRDRPLEGPPLPDRDLDGRRRRAAQEATQLAADTIRGEYYYDESAGIRVCIEKAIASANKRLSHQRERLGLHGDRRQRADRDRHRRRPRQRAVRRDGRAGRGLPDPPGPPVDAARPASRARPADRATSSPTSGAARSRSATRSSSSRRTSMTRLGPDELKDAMVTLHPQSAMEHLHHRFLAADGTRQRRDDRVRGDRGRVDPRDADARPGPAGRAAGRRARPLADPARRQRHRRRRGGPGVGARARSAAGGAFGRLVRRVQDLLPHRRRRTAGSRRPPPSARRSAGRRWRSSPSSSSWRPRPASCTSSAAQAAAEAR